MARKTPPTTCRRYGKRDAWNVVKGRLRDELSAERDTAVASRKEAAEPVAVNALEHLQPPP
jgi:hypothetical protein